MNDEEDDDEVKVLDDTANFSSDEELLDNDISGDTEKSENMFDSLKEDKSVEKSPEKPKPKRKLGPKIETSNPSKRPKKKDSYSGSDDDFTASKVRLISLFHNGPR